MCRFFGPMFAVLMIVACLTVPLPGFADQPSQCAECGMTVDPGSKFSAMTVHVGKTLQFCDIGDLLVHMNKISLPPADARVKDYRTGEWIGADKAFYVHSEKAFKTPMGWGIAAFKTKEDAAPFGAPLDIHAILRAVK